MSQPMNESDDEESYSNSDEDDEVEVENKKDGDRPHTRLRSKQSPSSLNNSVDTSVDNLSSSFSNNLSINDHKPRRNSGEHTSTGRTLYPSLGREKKQNIQGSSSLYPDISQEKIQYCSPERRSKSPSNHLWYWYIIAIVGVLIAAAALLVCAIYFNSSSGESDSSVYVEDIQNNMESIFRNQSTKSWHTIRSQLVKQIPRRNKTIQSTASPPNRPSVLLIVGTGSTLRCFSRKLGTFTAEAYKRSVCVRADPEENSDSGDVAKWHMDKVVENGYAQGDRCFHIQRLDRLSGPELLMLHAWCDGDHSHYKDSTILITLVVESVDNVTESKVESFLHDKWTPLVGADETPALLSRVANSIVIVNEEERTAQFDSHCLT